MRAGQAGRGGPGYMQRILLHAGEPGHAGDCLLTEIPLTESTARASQGGCGAPRRIKFCYTLVSWDNRRRSTKQIVLCAQAKPGAAGAGEFNALFYVLVSRDKQRPSTKWKMLCAQAKPGAAGPGEFNAFFYTLVSRDTQEIV